jgi:hypothetical protein
MANDSSTNDVAPYRQPFANPGRNSRERVAIHARPPFAQVLVLSGSGGYQHAQWLLGGAGNEIAVAGWPQAGSLVDLAQARERAPLGFVEHASPIYAEDSRQLFLPLGYDLRAPDMSAVDDRDRGSSFSATGIGEVITAIALRKSGFLLMSLEPGDNIHKVPTVRLLRRGYATGGFRDVRWIETLEGEVAHPSAMLSDDTLVAQLGRSVRLYAPDGGDVVQPDFGVPGGKLIAEIAVALRPALISADVYDRVWGFRAVDGALMGWDARGQSLGPALPLNAAPAQPPVALPGGAIAVIAPGAALKIEDGAIRWRAELPPSAHPLATADGDGKLVVRAGKQLVLIDETGKQVWSSELPAEITSNPLITSNGRLCVAAGLTLYCSQPTTGRASP